MLFCKTLTHQTVPWDSLNVQVVTKPKPWKALDSVVRRIGINAFGYGGTNSHAILESTDSYVRKEHLRHRYLRLNMPPSLEFTNEAQTPQSLGISNDNGAHLLLFSAHDEPTLRSTHIDYSKLDVRCTEDMLDLEYTMAFRRTKLPWRSFAIVRQENFQEDVMTASTQVVAPGRKAARPAFVFTGALLLLPQTRFSIEEEAMLLFSCLCPCHSESSQPLDQLTNT